MKKFSQLLAFTLFGVVLSGCSTDSTTSSGGSGLDASKCLTRSIKTVYTNECDYDINAIILQGGAQPFLIEANSSKTRSASGNSFGACRAPSMPILSPDAGSFSCS